MSAEESFKAGKLEESLATLQQERPGIFVAAVTHDVANSTITILLNAAPNQNTKVGWFVLELPD